MNKEYVIKAIVDDNDYRKIIGYFIDGKAYYLKNNSNKYDQKTSKKIIKNHGKEIGKFFVRNLLGPDGLMAKEGRTDYIFLGEEERAKRV